MRTYKFCCMTCNCNFNVESQYLIKKNNLLCPNCSSVLPDNVFEKLKTLSVSLDEYDENHPDVSKDRNAKHFLLTIQ